MTKKTKIITALVIGAVIGAGILAIKKKKHELSEIPVMKSYAMVVSTMDVKKAHVLLTLPYLATVKSDKSVLLSSRIAARVEQLAQCGSSVKKGDVVVSLDQRDLKDKKTALLLQINSAKADLSAKKIALSTTIASHKRTHDLLRVKGASREKFDKEKSQIESLKAAITSLENRVSILHANLSEIQTALSYAVLTAPQNATVSKCFINPGDMAMPGKPLLRLESDEGKYLLLRSADTVNVSSLLYAGKEYPVLALKHTFNGLREYRADIHTDRPDDEQVSVSLVIYDDAGVKVPLDALLQTEGKNYCFVAHGNKAEVRQVQIVARGVEGLIVKGLKEGEKIVIAKPDILLQLLGGKPIAVKQHK
ncbi:efflux RND transporter periplasmic adaptor subunit [Sulfurovum riftiae]|uniref:RND efflux pump membrane fusion protein barrel-sandwich domain-containing protein n=1 Tax=Sulfurovum riftiae TaxID=1630136 RepID=A0A151CE43_9BACT|nr:hypothetical protein [Sulfurovum riftiae]KYJ85800.1 hypothetical protein AS592_03420 [Sulfurovum riftiae]